MIEHSLPLILLLLSGNALGNKPRLVLQITVDDLRADLVGNYAGNFSDGGFNYLMNQGMVYDNA